LLRLGEWPVEQGRLSSPEDIFYLTVVARADLLAGGSCDWQEMIQARHDHCSGYDSRLARGGSRHGHIVYGGFGGSPPRYSHQWGGQVVGPVHFVQSMEDWNRVCRGDILVVSVIDPGMASLFGVAAGLVAEMDGTLSHGAIIAREYGLPAVANVSGVIASLKEGDHISLDAERGEIIVPVGVEDTV
jgi:rifampicin phosphotransferase